MNSMEETFTVIEKPQAVEEQRPKIILPRAIYGAIELKRNYQFYMKRGFYYSAIIHFVLVGLYWGYSLITPKDEQPKSVSITLYDEPKTLPSSQFGLSAYPVFEKPNLSEPPSSKEPAPKGWLKIKPVAPVQRTKGEGLGDIPGVKQADKIDVSNLSPETQEKSGRTDAVGGSNGNPVNDLRGGTVIASRMGDSPSGPGRSGIGSNSKPTPGIRGVGAGGDADGFDGGTGNGLGYSMNWLQGGTRKRISGDLPKYPEGVKVEAQISLLAVVSPDGAVKSLQPAKKGNTKLEDAAMKEVRHWRFEPLRVSQPQIDQKCEIIFLFTLK